MPGPTRIDEPGLSKREEAAVSTGAMSSAPWVPAAVTGGVVTAADLGLHLIGGSIGLHALSGSVSLGVVAFFVVAAAGALLAKRSGRALRWARANPWRFALVPGIAVAAIAFVLSVVLGGGIFGSIFSAAWHGAAAWGLTGVAGGLAGSRHRKQT
jgi:hypothetical protein